MKTKIKVNQFIKCLRITTLILLLSISNSCTNDDFLEEVPLDFYSPENSYVTYANFEAAIYNLYSNFRASFYQSTDYELSPRVTMGSTDLISWDENLSNWMNILNPYSEFVYTAFWKPCYHIIFDANVILGRSESEIAELTDEQKKLIQAEARFFRGYCYKMLADIYGGVPITLEESTDPKRDYVRASREEVYQQSVEDLKFASENLKNITESDDSRVNNLAAYHSLAEAYLSLKDFDNAITAASVTINDPAVGLMTNRFGSRVNDQSIPGIPWANGGDVYWDLFRKGNQNRSSGNTESLWVIQFGYNITGGYDSETNNGGYRWERCSSPRTWRINLNDKSQLLSTPNTYYGGRGSGQMRPSPYLLTEIWEKSGWDDDIRNADHNIIRDLIVADPRSPNFGKWIIKDKLVTFKTALDTLRNFYPIFAKISTMGDHPAELWIEDQIVPGSILSTGGSTSTTFANIYRIRLSETYLVRAEAYLGKGEKSKAAEDINIVRRRAKAPDVLPENVNIEYILDERARELAFEENRLQTLSRLGLLVERNRRYNHLFNLFDHQNLWPIPFSEIQKNTEAELIQNPGYN